MIVECLFYIKVKWFSLCTRFFCAVKNSNAFYCLWNSCQQVLCREWTEQVNADHTNLASFLHQVINCFTCCFCYRTHTYNKLFCVFCTIVAKEVVFAPSNLRYSLHIPLYNTWDFAIVFIRGFAVSKECFRVFSHTARNWSFGAHCT